MSKQIGAYNENLKSYLLESIQTLKMSTGSIVEVNKLKNIQVHLEKSIASILVNIKKYQELGDIAEILNTIQSNR